jgi:hypothetical protein
MFCRDQVNASHTRIPAAVLTGDYSVDDDVAHEFGTLGARLYFKPL